MIRRVTEGTGSNSTVSPRVTLLLQLQQSSQLTPDFPVSLAGWCRPREGEELGITLPAHNGVLWCPIPLVK